MAKIFSWKIDSYNYAYLYIDGNRHISEKIVDAALLSNMVAEMKKWTAEDARNAFEKMAEEVHLVYPNKNMEWSDEYWQEGGEDSSVVVLQGKDIDEVTEKKLEERFGILMEDIENYLAEVVQGINERAEELKSGITAKINTVVTGTQERVNSAISDMDATKTELINRLSEATEALNKASKLFEIDDSNIDAKKIKGSIEKVDRIDVEKIDKIDDILPIIPSISGISDDISDIKTKITDYDTYKDKVDDVIGSKDRWDEISEDYDTTRRKLADNDNTIGGVMEYISNKMISMSGTLNTVRETTNSNRIILNNIDNVVSGKVQTIMESTLQEINSAISSLSGSIEAMERRTAEEGEQEQSSDAPIVAGDFSFSNENGYAIEINNSGITLSHGNCNITIDDSGIIMMSDNGTDKISILNDGGIYLVGNVYVNGSQL